MKILSGLEPERVFFYFEELCAIPHGSANTKQISDYCVAFAKTRGLKYQQDEWNNVIIRKEATDGYEEAPTVILQGHLDMVCEKDPGVSIDFEQEGLRLQVEDGFVFAQGTTLGGDDGIAIAYILAILESDQIPHPSIEAVFTVDEEIGMLGAAAINCEGLQGKRMLNIDSEDEGILLVSCAGGVTASCHLPVMREPETAQADGEVLRLVVSGLTGGHSGTEIGKGRANASQVLGRVLFAMKRECSFRLVSVSGGLKDNAIPREAAAELLISGDIEAAKKVVCDYQDILQREYRITDPGIKLTLEVGGHRKEGCFNRKTTDNVITALVNLPGGICRMSREIDGLVQTSLNLGILQTNSKEVCFSFSVRSSVKSEKEELVARLTCLMESLGGTVTCSGDYPAWEYRQESPLRDIMVKVFEKQYGRKPEIQAIHAGVECGLFAGKIKDLDCVSFGPDIFDIHTPKERLSIESVERVWRYLLRILKEMK